MFKNKSFKATNDETKPNWTERVISFHNGRESVTLTKVTQFVNVGGQQSKYQVTMRRVGATVAHGDAKEFTYIVSSKSYLNRREAINDIRQQLTNANS